MIHSSTDREPAPEASQSSQNLLELRGIQKRFAGVIALKGVDLTLYRSEILALLGENGAGKSTLMKVLSGVHQPTAGSIWFEGNEVTFASPREAQDMGISIIYQEFSLIPYLSAAENIFFGREKRTRLGTLDKLSMKREATELLGKFGVHLDVSIPVAQLSIAEQQFVEIAKALARDTRILILDEPTATLTSQEVERLFRVMRDLKRAGVAMIFISHHLDEIFEIADRVQCLRDGQTIGTKAIAECNTEGLVRMIAGRDITHSFPQKAETNSGAVVLDIRNLQRKPHLPQISFQLRAGEILGFAGLIGSGRTEVVRAIIGADQCHRRDVAFQGKRFSPQSPSDSRSAGVGLLPEDRKRQGLILSFSVADNIMLTNLPQICHPVLRTISGARGNATVKSYIESVRIKTPSGHQAVRNLSGGNQQKVVIAKWLNADCQVLIFDEPTRGIDVGAKAEIYDLMRKLTAKGVSIIMISSELPEVVGMSDRVIVMRQHRIEKIIENHEHITAENIMFYATGAHHA